MKAIGKFSVLFISVSLLLLTAFMGIQVGYSDGWVNQTLNVTPAISCSVSKAALQFGTAGNPCVAGNISAGAWGCPVGQDESAAPGPSGVNVTASASNTAYMKVSISATDWLQQSGIIIDAASNEYYHVQNTTNEGTPPFEVSTSMPETSTAADTQLGRGNISYFWLNMTIPAGQWGGQYSSNMTFICAISGV